MAFHAMCVSWAAVSLGGANSGAGMPCGSHWTRPSGGSQRRPHDAFVESSVVKSLIIFCQRDALIGARPKYLDAAVCHFFIMRISGARWRAALRVSAAAAEAHAVRVAPALFTWTAGWPEDMRKDARGALAEAACIARWGTLYGGGR